MLSMIGPLLLISLGAVLGRIDGGGLIKMNNWVERLFIMLYFIIPCILIAGPWGIFAAIGVIGLITGPGQYFPGRALKAIEPEGVDFIVQFIFGDDWRTQFPEGYQFTREETEYYEAWVKPTLFLRNAFGMFVRSSLVGLPAMVICLIFGAWDSAFYFSLTGVAASFSYVICDLIWRDTAKAEYMNGGLRSLLALLAVP